MYLVAFNTQPEVLKRWFIAFSVRIGRKKVRLHICVSIERIPVDFFVTATGVGVTLIVSTRHGELMNIDELNNKYVIVSNNNSYLATPTPVAAIKIADAFWTWNARAK